MNKSVIQQIPKLETLPKMMPKENAVRLELEQGVVVFRASKEIQKRIEELLDKNQTNNLTPEEEKELLGYGEIDDYLSHVNRLIRNSFENAEVNLAA